MNIKDLLDSKTPEEIKKLAHEFIPPSVRQSVEDLGKNAIAIGTASFQKAISGAMLPIKLNEETVNALEMLYVTGFMEGVDHGMQAALDITIQINKSKVASQAVAEKN